MNDKFFSFSSLFSRNVEIKTTQNEYTDEVADISQRSIFRAVFTVTTLQQQSQEGGTFILFFMHYSSPLWKAFEARLNVLCKRQGHQGQRNSIFLEPEGLFWLHLHSSVSCCLLRSTISIMDLNVYCFKEWGSQSKNIFYKKRFPFPKCSK